MATFTYVPDYNASKSTAPVVRRTSFGDGYEERVTFGINTQPSQWNLSFVNRTNTERDNIVAFLEARAGTESFDWTPPYGSTAKWVCDEWDVTMNAYNLNTVQATFRQVFEA